MTLPSIADSSSALVDAGNLSALQQAAAAHNPQALRAAAQQFESLFTSMMLKSMRQANFSDPLFGSDQADMYQDMYDDQIAAQISKGRGLGLADMLVQQLQRSGLPGTQGSSSSTGSSTATTYSSSSGTSSSSSSGAATSAASGTSGATSSAAATGTSGAGTSSAPTASTGTSSCPSTAQQVQFAQSLWPQAQQAAQQLGVSPVSLLAQAALETDWGRSMPRSTNGSTSNNLFGIKAGAGWSGDSVENDTQEYQGGTATAVKAQFRSYSTPSQCFTDYVSLLQSNPRYAAALGTGDDTQAFGAALQRGGYATDPAYAAKLGAVANTLTRALTQARQVAAGSGYLNTGSLKSAAALPTTSGSDTL
jgi:peptidoglycan hydrolase FlgJ